jgi:hypothetical protein
MAVFAAIVRFAAAANHHQSRQQMSERGRALEPIDLFVGMRSEHETTVDQLRQNLARERRLPVELSVPTAKSHAEEWPVLAQRLSSRTIILPKHERLCEELLNLTVDLGPQGVRLLDRGKVHQDHAVSVRGVVAGLTTARHLASPEFIAACLAAGAEVASPWPSAPLATAGMGHAQDVQDDD